MALVTFSAQRPQEAKDFLVYAFDLSEKVGSPVIFRTTTRVSHMRGLVNFGPKKHALRRGEFKKDPFNLLLLPATAYRMKEDLVKRYETLKGLAEESPLNRAEGPGEEVGIITAGAAYNSLMDAIQAYSLKVGVLKLGFSSPFPSELVGKFLEDHTTAIVVEELDSILEEKIISLAQFRGTRVSIKGKMDGARAGCERNPRPDLHYGELLHTCNASCRISFPADVKREGDRRNSCLRLSRNNTARGAIHRDSGAIT